MWTTIKDFTQVEVGHCYTTCCHLDLDIICDEGELQEVRQMMVSDEPPHVTVWPSKITALTDMAKGYAGKNPEHIAECKDMLRALQNG